MCGCGETSGDSVCCFESVVVSTLSENVSFTIISTHLDLPMNCLQQGRNICKVTCDVFSAGTSHSCKSNLVSSMQVQKTKGAVGTEHPGLWFVLSDTAWDSFGTCGERSCVHTCASLLQHTGARGAGLFPRLSCCVCGRAGLSLGEQGGAEGCGNTSSLQGWLCLVLCTSCPCRTSQCCGCPSVPGHVLCLRAHCPGAGAGITVLAAQPGSVPVSLGQLEAGAVQTAQGPSWGCGRKFV